MEISEISYIQTQADSFPFRDYIIGEVDKMLVNVKDETLLGKEIWMSGSERPCKVDLGSDKITFQVHEVASISYPLSEFISSDYSKTKKFYDNREEAVNDKG